jgi:hypothetical protein
MLWYHLESVCTATLALLAIVTACAVYAYFLNSRRSPDDPEKRAFLFAAILLTPITFIPFLIGYILLLFLRALFYGICLLLSILILVVFRKWFFLVWLHKAAKYVGDKLLEANTLLIRLFLWPWGDRPRAI